MSPNKSSQKRSQQQPHRRKMRRTRSKPFHKLKKRDFQAETHTRRSFKWSWRRRHFEMQWQRQRVRSEQRWAKIFGKSTARRRRDQHRHTHEFLRDPLLGLPAFVMSTSGAATVSRSTPGILKEHEEDERTQEGERASGNVEVHSLCFRHLTLYV